MRDRDAFREPNPDTAIPAAKERMIAGDFASRAMLPTAHTSDWTILAPTELETRFFDTAAPAAPPPAAERPMAMESIVEESSARREMLSMASTSLRRTTSFSVSLIIEASTVFSMSLMARES